MRIRRPIALLLALLLGLICGVANLAALDLDIDSHLKIIGMTRAEPPQIIGREILFSYRSGLPVRHVGVAFGHESYANVWNLRRTENGVFVLLYRPESGLEEIVYRLVVDGLWVTDPTNGDTVTDAAGTPISRYRYGKLFPVEPSSPRIASDGTVELFYFGSPGKRVYLTGDFTNWEPFLYRLDEISPGAYRFSLPIPPGIHRYHFIVDGAPTIDRLNPVTAFRSDGKRVSVVVVQ